MPLRILTSIRTSSRWACRRYSGRPHPKDPLLRYEAKQNQELESVSASTTNTIRPTHFFRLWRLSNQSGIPNCKAANASKYMAVICVDSGCRSNAPNRATHAVDMQLIALLKERCAIGTWCSRSFSSKRLSAAAVAYVTRLAWTSLRKIGRSANHSMLNSMRANTSRCEARRDESTADAQTAAFSESAEGKLQKTTRRQSIEACA